MRTKEKHTRTRNENVKIRKEEERNFESVGTKWKEEPKLFCKLVNSKLKQGKGISKLIMVGKISAEDKKRRLK